MRAAMLLGPPSRTVQFARAPGKRRLISVLVTTYNRPDALSAVLTGLAAQSERGFEVVIADDGSRDETRALVESWRTKIDAPLGHVWQPDEGFRAAEARNRAILAARGDYVIFLDGDCVPRPGFLARHRALAERGWFVVGNRALLSEAATRRALAEDAPVAAWSVARWIAARLSGEVNRLSPLIVLPDGAWRKRRPARWEGARTCNLAAWRDDLIRIDGFDAAYQGWGLEDSDLAIRLMRAGVRRKDGRWATGVVHLWHREEDRAALAENRRRLLAVASDERIRATRGLSTLASDAP
jgi:glycosyltransferase involved in cell wall biosynthesis